MPRAIVASRIGEERQVTEMLERLEVLDLDSRAFQEGFLAFTETLVMHMWSEEAREWLPLETRWSEDVQRELGAWLQRAFDLAPTTPVGKAGQGILITGSAVPADLAACDFLGSRTGLAFRVLFQEAVDRLAECRPHRGTSGYFEIGKAGSRVIPRPLPDPASDHPDAGQDPAAALQQVA